MTTDQKTPIKQYSEQYNEGYRDGVERVSRSFPPEFYNLLAQHSCRAIMKWLDEQNAPKDIKDLAGTITILYAAADGQGGAYDIDWAADIFECLCRIGYDWENEDIIFIPQRQVAAQG